MGKIIVDSSICQHNKHGPKCLKCKELGIGLTTRNPPKRIIGGTNICDHNRVKSKCKECKQLGIGGTSLCQHNRQKHSCKECKVVNAIEIEYIDLDSFKQNQDEKHPYPINAIKIENYEEILENSKKRKCSFEINNKPTKRQKVTKS
jgi:hypothetical protein